MSDDCIADTVFMAAHCLRYRAVHGVWSVEELADRLTDYGEVARGGCLVAGYFSVKTSTVLKEGHRRTRPNMKRCCISDFPLSTFGKFHQSQTVHSTIMGRHMHLKLHIQQQ